MRRQLVAMIVFGLALCPTARLIVVRMAATDAQPRRMSLHNRLLLNRAIVSHLEVLEVMLLARDGGLAAATSLAERLGGRVKRTEPTVGYARVDVPTNKLVELVSSRDIDAYQVSSMSTGSWYRDAHAEKIADMLRRAETAPVYTTTPRSDANLPFLPVERSRNPGYTADDDVGVGEWVKAHPTFDGRGVTVAVMKTGLAEFTHPTLGFAKSLDGRDVPKLAGIFNTIGDDDPDETRVELGDEIHAVSTWSSVEGRTLILPRPGHYRFGFFTMPTSDESIERFGILEDETTHDIRVDTKGDGDFRDETPIADVNDKMDVRTLRVESPHPIELSFVIARGHSAHTVNVYAASADHPAMTVSVVAGSRTADGLAFGVAPGARVLLVRMYSRTVALHNMVEGYLAAVARPDVDVLCDSAGINAAPDTAADFMGLLFRRIVAAYGKPIFHDAGNLQLFPASVSSLGAAFSVGGSLGPGTFAALYGGASLNATVVHHASAAGPSVDGLIKPDFLAPMERIAGTIWSDNPGTPLPKNAPRFRLPPGYTISCCTSASAPYAAGVAALLLSAARQQQLPYSPDRFARALKIGAHFLSNAASSEQGNGVLDVNAAWLELHRIVNIPRIRSTAHVAHPWSIYAAHGDEGEGIFEEEGWRAGMTGRRDVRFRRESGPASPATYRVDWTGNDGTFAAPTHLTLPLTATVSLPVAIAIHSTGAHSALLNLHDPATDAIVFRTQATIVAPATVDPATHAVRLTGSIPLMQQDTRFVTVPDHLAALSVDLEVIHGSVMVSILAGSGLLPLYSPLSRVYAEIGRTFAAGHYRVVLPYPVAGTWGIDLNNTSARREHDQALVRTETAEYAVTITMLGTAVQTRALGHGSFGVEVENTGAALGEPVLETSRATIASHTGSFLPNGLPNLFDIDVPVGATTLAVNVHTVESISGTLELYLYDCTSGECFARDFTVPAAPRQFLIVRKPTPGRWVAAINDAPFPTAPGGFVIDTIVASGVPRRSSVSAPARGAGEKWSATAEIVSPPDDVTNGVLFEIVDLAIQRGTATHKWETRDGYPDMSDIPAAVGMTFERLGGPSK